jgi:hypothetical protein
MFLPKVHLLITVVFTLSEFVFAQHNPPIITILNPPKLDLQIQEHGNRNASWDWNPDPDNPAQVTLQCNSSYPTEWIFWVRSVTSVLVIYTN